MTVAEHNGWGLDVWADVLANPNVSLGVAKTPTGDHYGIIRVVHPSGHQQHFKGKL